MFIFQCKWNNPKGRAWSELYLVCFFFFFKYFYFWWYTLNLVMSFCMILSYIILGWYHNNLGWKYCLLFNWEKNLFCTNKKFAYLTFIKKLLWYHPKINFEPLKSDNLASWLVQNFWLYDYDFDHILSQKPHYHSYDIIQVI